MGITATAAAIASTGVKAYGQMKTAGANAAASNYNAKVADNNAAIATQQAEWEAEAGEQAVANKQLETRARVGSIEANQGASGVEVGTGSNADVKASARELGMYDAMTIRSNAVKRAYGYQVESVSDKAQANLDRFAAKNDLAAGRISAGATILGGAARADQYSGFLDSKSMFGGETFNNNPGMSSSDSDVLAGAL